MNSTCYRAIENADGSIQLHDLYNSDYSCSLKPCLTFVKATGDDKCWDNEDYLLDFFRGVKRNKKKWIKELKNFCKDNNYDYQSTLEDLLDIYKSSKQLKFWKNGKS